ncbi:pilus assembly protein [Thermomonas fusca]
MKTKPNSTSPMQRAVAVAAATVATLLGLPVNAATTSFPQYPLMTGGSTIPPNILLILDDSGSMNFIAMPKDVEIGSSYQGVQNGLNDDPVDRSYIHNTLYYNPTKTYRPWRTASTDLNDRLSNAVIYSAASSPTSPSSGSRDLRGHTDGIFYYPKVANPGTSASNYDRYWISSSGKVVVAGSPVSAAGFPKGPLSSSMDPYTQRTFVIPVSADTAALQVTTSGGGKNVELNLVNPNGNTVCTSSSGNGSESCSVLYPVAGDWVVQVYRDNSATFSNVSLSATITPAKEQTPTGRSQADEIQNFANWYQYHRTRNKMAKAGASEAFGRLGKNYRVGFDTIWNRGGGSQNTSGSTPALPIAYSTDGGLFQDTNRSTFYSRLHGAGASSGTPLHGALQRAGRYFGTDDPWKDSNGSLVTCRQNYAILTTDGYWNSRDDSDSGYTSVGNADSSTNRDVDGNPPKYPDSNSNTLADVAYQYWRRDLRSDMTDNVRASSSDPAKWQHMVTFGVSIGLQGTLNPNNPPPATWPNPNDNEDAERIDDLWHAALNGRGAFVVASDTDRFAQSLSDALKAIDGRTASGSNIASSSTKTDTTTLTFVAGFTSSTWLGDLIASPFNAALTGVSTTPSWVLSKTFEPSGVNAAFASRTILTSKGGTARLFTSVNFSGDSDFAARTGQADAVTAAENVAYLRGDQSKEIGQTNGTLRKRIHPVGDIVDSSPSYVAGTNTVYIGANDGMLHGINAANGKVLFSYMPKGLNFTALANLSSTSYDHHYFVDGQIDVARIDGNGSNFINVLVAALGRGGRGVFALNVTAPGSMGTGDVLWDNTTQDTTTDPNMGYVLGAVRIRKGNGDKTYAFVPNGIDSPNGSATLFVYELANSGAVVSTTRLVADAGTGNGLMSLGMADLNSDGTVDTVYGGDLKGNVWRWDFSGNALPTAAVKLFQAVDSTGNGQPITGGIGVGRDELSGKVFVGFGTGRFISTSDVPTASAMGATQSLYGLLDEGTAISGRNDLQVRTIPYTGTSADGRALRGFETYSALPGGKKGWYIDFTPPERVISAPTIYGTAMFIASVIPSAGGDGCEAATGSGFLNGINLFTGTSPNSNSGGYFPNSGTVSGGLVGSIGVSGGMPTEVNVTSGLATVGTGAFSSEDGAANTVSEKLGTSVGGQPRRVNWREIVPLQ